jgi:hypothetical protein
MATFPYDVDGNSASAPQPSGAASGRPNTGAAAAPGSNGPAPAGANGPLSTTEIIRWADAFRGATGGWPAAPNRGAGTARDDAEGSRTDATSDTASGEDEPVVIMVPPNRPD